MAIGIFVLIITAVFIIFDSLNGKLWRKPWILLALGLVVAVGSTLFKSHLLQFNELDGYESYLKGMDSVVFAVDGILIALSGGLICSAFVRKIEKAHTKEISDMQLEISSLKKDIESHISELESLPEESSERELLISFIIEDKLKLSKSEIKLADISE